MKGKESLSIRLGSADEVSAVCLDLCWDGGTVRCRGSLTFSLVGREPAAPLQDAPVQTLLSPLCQAPPAQVELLMRGGHSDGRAACLGIFSPLTVCPPLLPWSHFLSRALRTLGDSWCVLDGCAEHCRVPEHPWMPAALPPVTARKVSGSCPVSSGGQPAPGQDPGVEMGH